MYKALEAEKSAAMVRPYLLSYSPVCRSDTVQERLGTQQQSRPVPAASTHLHMSALLSQLGRCVLTVRPYPVLVVVLSGGRHVEALQHAQLAVAKMTMTGDATLPDADDSMLQVLLGTPKRYPTHLSLFLALCCVPTGRPAAVRWLWRITTWRSNRSSCASTSAHSKTTKSPPPPFYPGGGRWLTQPRRGYELARRELGDEHKTTQQLLRSMESASDVFVRTTPTPTGSFPPHAPSRFR
jgi:hypothetical protein